MTFTPGQPLAIDGGFAAYFGDMVQQGRIMVVCEDGSVLNTAVTNVKPLRWWDTRVWLGSEYHYHTWQEFGASTDIPRLQTMAKLARLAVEDNLAFISDDTKTSTGSEAVTCTWLTLEEMYKPQLKS